jgi:hypothetical protein
MNELQEFNDRFQPVENTNENPFHLFIVGSKLRESTATRYDDVEPRELIIDESIQDWLLSTTKAVMSHILEYEIVDINVVDEASESIKRFIDVEQINQLANWQHVVSENQVEQSAHELINDESFKPKAMIAKIQIGEQSIAFLKVINEGVLLKTRIIFGFNVDRGSYHLESGQNRKLFIDEQWDAIIFENKMIMNHESKVLSLFRYYEKFKEAAERVVEGLMESGLIADANAMLGFVTNQISLQKKLARAANYPLDSIRRDRIQTLIDGGVINLSINREGQIECTTKEEAKVVVDVIMDNYVTSMITDENYRALNKSKI